jgi:hypothetical protein
MSEFSGKMEELEDIAAFDLAIASNETPIPWDEVKKELGFS